MLVYQRVTSNYEITYPYLSFAGATYGQISKGFWILNTIPRLDFLTDYIWKDTAPRPSIVRRFSSQKPSRRQNLISEKHNICNMLKITTDKVRWPLSKDRNSLTTLTMESLLQVKHSCFHDCQMKFSWNSWTVPAWQLPAIPLVGLVAASFPDSNLIHACLKTCEEIKKHLESIIIDKTGGAECQVGLSENSVPLNPMVNDHYPYTKWL